MSPVAERGSARSRRVDPGGIFWTLVFVAVALIGLIGNGRWLLNTSTWWIAALVIAVLGVLMMVFSGSGGRDRPR